MKFENFSDRFYTGDRIQNIKFKEILPIFTEVLDRW